jgi:DNA-binding beta-propeller fold protein YncE
LLILSAMPRAHLVVLLSLAGCVHNGGGGGGGSGDAGGDDVPPFTNGVSTLSGAGEPGYVDGKRGVARFNNPTGVAVGPDGKIYVADFDNGKIRVVDADGTAGTVIAQMGFARPFGLAFAGETLWVTTDDDENGRHTPLKSGSIWKVDISAKSATIVANAIGMPRGIAPLGDGRIAVSDHENHVIEVIGTSGNVTVLAGSFGAAGFADGCGMAARFSQPVAMVLRADGTLVVADEDNNRLRLVTAQGCVTTLTGGAAGFADGDVSTALFSHPEGLAIASNGDLFITDTANHRVRRISGSKVDTIAGDGNAGYIDDDDRLASELFAMEGVAVKADGSLVYVADGTGGEDVPFNRIRQIKMQ